MGDRITASFDTLLSQASMTAGAYMSSAVREIDETFGSGFAKANPALVAAFMQVASADFATASNGKILGSALDRISGALSDVAEALRDQG
ncbi:hypothetical protein ACO2Q2_17350 [Dyella sp. KRB-257]|uniref:hypothetical protein n=1 Tax=Dyella sp. KRB-257 TaxID=3400915 RepID=UPI003C10DE5B